MDKFIVKSNITFNKLQDFETVSRGSRHRSNHTQKNIPSVVAGHQFLQFGCMSPDTGTFPITMWYIQASAWKQISLFSKCCFHQTASSGVAACLWHLLRAEVVLHVTEEYKSIISHVAWDNLNIALSLFSESIAICHHSRQEWHHWSYRLHHSFWQIWDVNHIFIWNNWSTFQCLLPLSGIHEN